MQRRDENQGVVGFLLHAVNQVVPDKTADFLPQQRDFTQDV